MSDGQLWALLAFAAFMLLLSLFMWPAPRQLNGQQKYRKQRREGPDLDPEYNRRTLRDQNSRLFAVLGSIFSSGAASATHDASDAADADSGDAGGEGGGD